LPPVTSGSDEHLHFSATLEQAEAEAREFHKELREIDPVRESQEPLAIYEMVLRIPDHGTIVDALNEPSSFFRTFVVSKKLVALSVE